MSLLNNNMPEVGTPEYFAMLEGIPAMLEAKTAANKARFAPIVKAAGLNPDTYDYANIQPEIFDKIGSQDARALKLSTMDYGNQERVNDFGAYTDAAGRAISGGLTDDQMWADYDKNKYKQSDFQNFMQSGIKAGLGAMVGAGIGNAAGLWNLGGETAALGVNNVGAMTPLESGIGVMPELGASTLPSSLGGPITSGFTPLELASVTSGTGGFINSLKDFAAPVVNGIKGINDFTGGNLGAIVGGLAGAASAKDTTTTASKDPWAPAQPYLKDNLAQNKRMQDYYMANPFSQEQKTAYQGLLDTNANGLANGSVMAGMANNFMSSNRGLMGQMPQFISGTKAPTVDWSKYSNIGKG